MNTLLRLLWRQNTGSCAVTQIDGHDMTVEECANSGNSFNAGNMLYG